MIQTYEVGVVDKSAHEEGCTFIVKPPERTRAWYANLWNNKCPGCGVDMNYKTIEWDDGKPEPKKRKAKDGSVSGRPDKNVA